MELTEEIKRIVESKLTDPSQFLVEVLLSSKKGPKKLLIIIDGDNGVTIDDCGNISRELSKALDDSSLLDENYMLEVSTPGLDHPLKLKRQYKKNIGRKLKIKLADKIVEGQLKNVSDEVISLDQETGSGKKKEVTSLDIPFSEIEKAFVLVSFK
jgi:ribosome maturation factor RimP